MTYLYRLAKRIAGLRPALILGTLVGLACSKGEKVGFLSPDPSPTAPNAFSLRVEPLIASVRSGDNVQFTATGYSAVGGVVTVTVDWTATGGAVGPDGRFTGGIPGQNWVIARIRSQPAIADSALVSVWDPQHELVELIVFPDSAVVETGDSLQATAALRMANGDLTNEAAVTWSSNGGSINQEGVFTAPDSGSYIMTAVSPAGLRGNARVLVRSRLRRLERISVNPPVATLLRGESASFSATAHYNDNTTGPGDVIWSSTGGSVTSAGLYVAGGVPGSYIVVARDENGSVADTAQIAISAPTVTRLAITPKTLAIEPGAIRQFSALAEMSDDTWQTVPLTWSANGGTVSATGVYTAPASAGTFEVVVRSPGLTVADTAYVIVTQPAATMTAVRINPASVSMGGGESRQFTATADWSDGSSTTPLVTWTATGGQINPGGLYAAGLVAGTYRVIATTAAGLADTSAVVVTPAVLTRLTLTPPSASILVGQSVEFAVAGSWSDGSSAVPSVVWTAPGGTMSGSRYLAGPVGGTFAIIARQTGGGPADTAFVTISVPPATLTTLLLTPTSGVLARGAWLDFNVTGTWSNGSTVAPLVTYTATGGTMSGKRYTAGNTSGTYRVIARHSASGKADTSSVLITTPVTLSTLVISPETASLAAGGIQQFAFTGTWSNGSTAIPLVTWTATGGSVTTAGRYTAGTTPGSYRVIVAHQGGTRRDTASVTVLGAPPPPPPPPPAPTLTTLSVSPDPVSLAPAATRQFTLSATWSNGGTTVPAVTWSATGGTVTSLGYYTAGASAGAHRVIATQQGGAKADTAAVTITSASTPVLTSLVVSPASANLLAGTSQAFSVLGSYSNGTTGSVSVTWTATGGTITSAGVFTAGAGAGNYSVQATLVGGPLNDSSPVTITVPSTSGCAGGANQPGGFFAIVGRRFNTIGTGTNGRGTGPLPCQTGGSEGFDDVESRYSTTGLIQDASSPLSPGGVLRFTYPAQAVPNTSTFNPGVVQTLSFTGSTYGPRLYRKIYLRTAFRVSANWQGHQTSTNKLIFIRSNGSPRMEPIIRLRGSGSNALELNVDLQGSLRDKRNIGTQTSLSPNQPGAAGAGQTTSSAAPGTCSKRSSRLAPTARPTAGCGSG